MKRNDLLLQYGENELIEVKYAKYANYQIEKVELNDGSYLTNSDIDYIIQQINAYGDEHGMTHIDNDDIRQNSELMGIITGAWHHE